MNWKLFCSIHVCEDREVVTSTESYKVVITDIEILEYLIGGGGGGGVTIRLKLRSITQGVQRPIFLFFKDISFFSENSHHSYYFLGIKYVNLSEIQLFWL